MCPRWETASFPTGSAIPSAALAAAPDKVSTCGSLGVLCRLTRAALKRCFWSWVKQEGSCYLCCWQGKPEGRVLVCGTVLHRPQAQQEFAFLSVLLWLFPEEGQILATRSVSTGLLSFQRGVQACYECSVRAGL